LPIAKGEAPKKTAGGKCFNIFCCGYCCSKGTGVSDKEKAEEANLSRPEKKQDIQIHKSTNKGKKGSN